MPKEQKKDLIKFLKPFSKDIRETALWLREFIWELYPNANELIYDNYNAVAVGWSPTERVSDTFCSIAVGSNKYVHFGFYWGSKIPDPDKILLGNGNQYRYITVKDRAEFPKAQIKKLMKEAYSYSMSKLKEKPASKGMTLVKSISAKKKRPK